MLIDGDMIDGKGERSGGVEQITTDMSAQCDMAVSVVEHIRRYCKKNVQIIGTYGTPYHTSVAGDDWEKQIAKDAGFTKIGAHEWIDVNGCIIDLKHHIGSSSVPHGRYTAVARDMLWNTLWADMKLQPKSQITLRAHVHYHEFCGNSRRMGMTLPALQGLGSKFGAKICSGVVDFGFMYFGITSADDFEYKPFINTIVSQAPEVVKI